MARLPGQKTTGTHNSRKAAATKATADSARGEALRLSTVGCQLSTNAARRDAETRSRSCAEQGKIARFPFPAVKEPSA